MEEDLEYPVENHSDSEEQDDDDFKHTKLLDAISSLDGKKKPTASQRTVPTNEISEFNFSTNTGSGKVKLHELVGTLRDTTSHGTLKKQLRAVQKRAKIVATPLPRLEQERIQRSLAYETTSKEISKWDPVVDKNRKAEQLKFPLQQPDLKVLTRTDEFIKRFQARTPLEKEVAALLHGSDSVMENTEVLSAAEQRALDAMSLEEAKLRRAELQKYRVLLSYKETKARWQKKIKSKSYHKHLRKSRQKEELRAVEELKKNDPEAYIEKMKQLEKDRIEERMNLKHRGGSKFIQRQKMYSKYQDQARQAVQDMYEKSRELTQKTAVESDSDQESVVSLENEDELHLEVDSKGSNPWMSAKNVKKIRIKSMDGVPSVDTSKAENLDGLDRTDLETRIKVDGNWSDDTDKNSITRTVDETVKQKPKASMKGQHLKLNPKLKSSRGKKECSDESEDVEDSFDSDEDQEKSILDIDELFEKLDNKKDKKTEEKQKPKKKKVKTPTACSKTPESTKPEQEDEEIVIKETLKKKAKFEDFEEDIDEEEEEADNVTRARQIETEKQTRNKNLQKSTEEVFVDPKKLFTLERKVKSAALPDIMINDDEDMTEEDQRMTIAQAFADDDVIEEFTREKEEVTKRQKLKDIDLTLPGWGQWGGTGIKVSKRKRKRFLIKAPQGPPRKDIKLGNVIISEQKDDAIAKHQVSHLPFPYTNIQQFERSVRAPVGKTWNPETAFKKMIKPKIVTRLGTVIKPIDKSEMFEKEKVHKGKQADIMFSSDDGKKRKGRKFRRKQRQN